MRRLVAIILITLGVAACQKESESLKSNQGGIDSSGGDVTGSSYQVFAEKVANLQSEDLPNLLHRLEFLTESKICSPYCDQDLPLLRDLLGGEAVAETLQRVHFVPTSGYCEGDGSSRDGSAQRNSNEICLSYQAFKKMNEEQLTSALQILSLHEFSHLRGFHELKARRIQATVEKWSQSFELPIFEPKLAAVREQLEIVNKLQLQVAKMLLDVSKNQVKALCVDRDYEPSLLHGAPTNYFSASISDLVTDTFSAIQNKVDCRNFRGLGFEVRQNIVSLLKENIVHHASLGRNLAEFIDFKRNKDGRFELEYYSQLRMALLDLADMYLVPNFKSLPTTSPDDVNCAIFDLDKESVIRTLSPGESSFEIEGIGSVLTVISQGQILDQEGKAIQVQISTPGIIPGMMRTTSEIAFIYGDFLTLNLQRARRESADVPIELYQQSVRNPLQLEKVASLRLKCRLR